MAHGKHTRNPGYGDHWVTCDVCGFDIRAGDIRERWDGLMVCPADYEMRHPQDFVRTLDEYLGAVGPVRPEPTAVYTTGTCSEDGISGVAGDAVAGCMIAGGPTAAVPTGTFNTETL